MSLLLLGLCGKAPAAPAAPLLGRAIPLADFFAEPDASSLTVSPDGKLLAFLTKLGTGRLGIVLFHLDTGAFDPLVVPKDDDILEVYWKDNDTLLYRGQLNGNESYSILSFSIKARKVKSLIGSSDYYSVGILDLLRNDPDHVLLGGFRPRRLNIRTGFLDEAESVETESEVGNYLTDRDGAVRMRSRYEGDQLLYEWRPAANTIYKQYAASPINHTEYEPVVMLADNQTAYLLTHDQSDTSTLRTFNAKTGQLGPVIFNDPRREISRLVVSRDHTKVYGAVLAGGDRSSYVWFDEHRAKLQATLDRSLPNTQNDIISSSDNEHVAVVLAYSDREPGVYYILNLDNAAQGRPAMMQFPIRANSHLVSAQLQPMRPISYSARDGLVIHGYLTLPAGAEGHRVPLIIHPHGGPFGISDDWGFDPEVQFLASRGYAVLQPNYRGSSGYGDKFEQAGYREWGGKMQDDLTDAVKWAEAEGFADPARVCIYGGSYGGYAALAGVTTTPDLYCCAINYVGVSDLRLLTSISRHPDRSSQLFFAKTIGTGALLDERSPVNHVEQIKVPTLHSYGENDRRVIEDHWKRLEAALKRFNKPYEYIKEEKEGHGFQHLDSRLRYYGRMEQFLAKYLAPPATP